MDTQDLDFVVATDAIPIAVDLLEAEGFASTTYSPKMEIFQSSEEDATVIGEIVAIQRRELEEEIAGLEDEAARVAEEARELAGELPF